MCFPYAICKYKIKLYGRNRANVQSKPTMLKPTMSEFISPLNKRDEHSQIKTFKFQNKPIKSWQNTQLCENLSRKVLLVLTTAKMDQILQYHVQ